LAPPRAALAEEQRREQAKAATTLDAKTVSKKTQNIMK
jgi:hypothetical protein